MPKLLTKPLYIPRNLKVEIKPFLNGYIFWFSSFLYTFKKIIFLTSNISQNNSEIALNLKTSYQRFYVLSPLALKKEKTKALSLFYIENTQNTISSIVGYKKNLNTKGIGYKFSLKNSVLFLEVGYSHLLSFTWRKSFKAKFSRKLKGIQVKNKNLQLLMNFLSNIKRNRPINIYTRKGIRYNKENLKYKEGKRKKSF